MSSHDSTNDLPPPTVARSDASRHSRTRQDYEKTMHAAVNEKSTTTKTGSDTYLMLKDFLAPRVVIKRRDDGTADPRTFFFTEEAAEDAILQSPFADDERVSLTQRDDDFWYFYLSDERDVPLKLEFDTSRAELPREVEYEDVKYNANSNIARFVMALFKEVGEDAVSAYERVHGCRVMIEFKRLYCFVCEEGVELPWNAFIAFKENAPETVAIRLLAMECSTRNDSDSDSENDGESVQEQVKELAISPREQPQTKRAKDEP